MYKEKDTTLYKGWLTLKERILNDRRYEILIKKDAVAALVEDNEGRLLLVRQFRPALLRDTWEIPAGCMDKEGLDEREIMVEELAEEANIILPKEDLTHLISYIPEMGISGSVIHLYYTKLGGPGIDKAITDDLDVTESRWFTKAEIEDMIKRQALLDSKTQLAYYYYKANQ